LREKRNYVYALPPFENLYPKSFFILYFFFHPPTWLGHTNANSDRRTLISAWAGEFFQVSIFAKLVCQTAGGQFFLFYQK
jgi:hypothetical protein